MASTDTDVRPTTQRTRRAKGTRAALIIVVGIVLVLVAGMVGAAMFVQGRINAGIERFDDPFAELSDRPVVPEDVAGDGDPVNILFLGSDVRIDPADPDSWSDSAGRTDALMLAQVSGDRKRAYLMSIPRDSWVEVPGHGMHKINAAFAFGGPSLTIATVEQLTGVHIHHIAVANFESFAAMTDELGGVEINLPQGIDTQLYEKDENGQWKDLVLPPGEHLLDGAEALAYARQRHGVPGGDFGRVQRQQNWMKSIMQAAYRKDLLTNPAGLTSFLETVGRTVAVDEGFTIGEMRDLALSMRDIRPPDVVYMTAPHNGTGRSPDGQSIVLLDEAGFGALADAFAHDTVADYLEAHPDAVVTLDEDPA